MIIYSGLPRSGTNLLKNILYQNDKIHINHESALCNIISHSIESADYYKSHYYSDDVQDLEKLQKMFITGGISNIDKNINKPHINHNKLWNKYLPKMKDLGYKIIFSVRNITDILFSFEEQYKKNFTTSINKNLNFTNPLIGMLEKHETVEVFQNGLDFLNDVCINFEEYKDNLLFIKYENLVNHPNKTLSEIYSFLDLEPYQHDFSNIPTYNVNDMSSRIRRGISHQVRPRLDNVLKQKKFTSDIKEYFYKRYFSINKLLGYT